MDKIELLQAIAADMDAEYAHLEKHRQYGESVSANTVVGRLQELAWWAAHLRALAANGGEHRPPVGSEGRRHAEWERRRLVSFGDTETLAREAAALCFARFWRLVSVTRQSGYQVTVVVEYAVGKFVEIAAHAGVDPDKHVKSAEDACVVARLRAALVRAFEVKERELGAAGQEARALKAQWENQR